MGCVLACVCLCLTAAAKPNSPPAAKDSLPPSVSVALKQANIPREAISILVRPVQATPDAPLPMARLSHRASAEMNPASVMK